MAAHMGDFAKNHLKRHGWKAGSGLGRNEDGISEPIKVKIKRDSAGVGHDAAEQFTFHWWDHVFNKAASNIQVKNSDDGVELQKKENETDVISNKKPIKSSSKKETLYGMFVKSATLTTEGEKAVSSSSEDEHELAKLDFSSGLADDELFKACGGRTAHKGARHGLKASGKLQRLQEQERLLNEKETVKDEESVNKSDEPVMRKKKKKKSKKHEGRENIDDHNNDINIERKKKKQKTKVINEVVEDSILLQNEDFETEMNTENNDKKRKKRRRRKDIKDDVINDQVIDKESKSGNIEQEESSSIEDSGLKSEKNVIKKKNKKRKKQLLDE